MSESKPEQRTASKAGAAGGGSLTLEGGGSSLLARAVGKNTTPPGSGLNNAEPLKESNEESKLPMLDDRGSEPASAAVPDDTFHLVTGQAGSRAGDSSGGSSAGASTNVDTIIGRLVIEQGLATPDEVAQAQKKCQAQSDAAGEDPSHKSLAQILIEDEIVTTRQLDRLKRTAEEERKGQAIPGYKVLGKLGAGAMATVFKARQLSLDRLVAIKILPRKFSGNPQFIQRFHAEGRAAAQLNHPNIVQAYDVGRSGEFHYFVMEYVDGSTVYDAISQNKRFKEDDAIDIVISVAEALEHSHDRGMIHRDVKPKNIMLTKQGVVKLADLGLARAIEDKDAAMAEAGKAYGTPYYISPEQIRGELNVGAQADIYSLGATLYHMVTGNVPFNGKNPTEVMQKHLKVPLVPPDHVNPKLSAGISEVIEMMMAKSRKNRYKDCHDLLVDLRAARRGELPPMAHMETPASALEEVLSSDVIQQAPLIERNEAGPFDHPSARLVLYAFIGVTAFAIAMTFAALWAWFGR